MSPPWAGACSPGHYRAVNPGETGSVTGTGGRQGRQLSSHDGRDLADSQADSAGSIPVTRSDTLSPPRSSRYGADLRRHVALVRRQLARRVARCSPQRVHVLPHAHLTRLPTPRDHQLLGRRRGLARRPAAQGRRAPRRPAGWRHSGEFAYGPRCGVTRRRRRASLAPRLLPRLGTPASRRVPGA